MKKILVFALICTLILGVAMAEVVTETAAATETMTCQNAENCPMAGENCANCAQETAAVCESCCAGEETCQCETCVDGECVCENCEAVEPFYLLPESNVRLIEKSELEGTDKETLALMRNEILARHGYPFKKAQYQEYFGNQIWYEVNNDFDYNMLSKIEMDNVETIKKLEEAK